jgi:excinuclease ABC subunit A
LVIPDWNKSINEEALAPLGKPRPIWFFNQLEVTAEKYGFNFDTKLADLLRNRRIFFCYGTKEKISFTYAYGGSRPATYMHKFAGLFNYLKNYYSTQLPIISGNGLKHI